MAIDIKKIENLLIDEGTLADPFILTDTEVTTLYSLATSNNKHITVKGVVDTTTHTILKYQSYQMKKTWPDLTIVAEEVASKDWSVQLVTATITELETTSVIATNIALESLEYSVHPISLEVTSGSYGEQDVIDHLHFDNKTGIISYDAPTSNAGWLATVTLNFWPSYDTTDVREVTLRVRAIAVTAVTITAPSRIDESATTTITLSPYPSDHTKSGGLKYSLSTQYGTLSPASGVISTYSDYVFFAPPFDEQGVPVVPYKEDEEGKYYTHTFLASFYMFGNTQPSGTATAEVLMKNTTFKVTCDTDSLVEAEQAEFSVIGFLWDEVQKTMIVDEASLVNITEEELRQRCGFLGGPYFSMYDPTDNATFSADVTLYIAPPGAEPTGKRAISFPMHLEAVGLTSLSLSPQTIGQNVESVINIDYLPKNQTKGDLTFSFACSDVVIQSRDDENGIYQLFSDTISTEGLDATIAVYSPYVGTGTPMLQEVHKLYVQNIYFNVTFDEAKTQRSITIDEGKTIQCYVDILHISELRRNITVNITQGADLIDNEFITSRLHFSDTIDTDLIWFDEPEENISWKATITIQFIAKYIPEGVNPPYSQTVTINVEAREVTGIEWYDEKLQSNYQITTAYYHVSKYLRINTLPATNTKKDTLYAFDLQHTHFSISTLAAGLTMNQASSGRFSTIANENSDWTVYGYLDCFSSSENYGSVNKNIDGSSTQGGILPSTENIIYPTNKKLYDKTAATTLELLSLDNTYKDQYVVEVSEEETEKTLIRRVKSYKLSDATYIWLAGSRVHGDDSVCFYIEVDDKAYNEESEGYSDNVLCSHFARTDEDLTTTDVIDRVANSLADTKVYFRISNTAINLEDPSIEEDDTVILAIKTYLQAQYDAGTPVTLYYPRVTAASTEYENTLYYDNIFFTTPVYHIYTANNQNYQCSVDFLDNDTTATTRTIFGNNLVVSEDNNKYVESMKTENIRADVTKITKVPFFSGIPTSIDQYDEDGNLITDSEGNAEKGEVNIWENFSAKYQEWTEEGWKQVNWDFTGSMTQDGTPTADNPVYPTCKQYYINNGSGGYELTDLYGMTYNGTYYGMTYTYLTQELAVNMTQQSWDGTANVGINNILTNYVAVQLSGLSNMAWSTQSGNFLCSMATGTTDSLWSSGNINQMVWHPGSGRIIWSLPHSVLGTSKSSSSDECLTAVKAFLAEHPVTVWYPTKTTNTLSDRVYYKNGITHHKYTISKLINDDDTGGDASATNNFVPAMVYDKNGNIPERFFLSRFIPGWHDNDNTGIISMAKGLQSQQRTINSDIIASQGCYYKNDAGELTQVTAMTYKPLLAYTWLAYITYGTINLKDSVGSGASKVSVDGQVFADNAGTKLTIGEKYSTVFIITNALITADTYQNYDFNIIGSENADDIAMRPIYSYKILGIETSGNYTAITLGDENGNAASYTALASIDYYSINSCFSTTGYSERTYTGEDGKVAVSGYGTTAKASVYNDNRHPVRCLNIENMWGGGAYSVEGTAFRADDDDNTIFHPEMWDPSDSSQSLDDISSWSRLSDLEVLRNTGTWDIGSVVYKDSKCGWPLAAAGEDIPYRGYNVYNRYSSLLTGTDYYWNTGTYSDFSDRNDYPSMCGLGHVEFNYDPLSGYQELEYVAATSANTYINTGITYNASTMKAELELSVLTPSVDAKIFQPFNNSQNYTSGFSIYNSKWRDSSIAVTTDKTTLCVDKGVGTINGTTYKTWTGTPFTSMYFPTYPGWGAASTRVYAFRLYENDILTQDWIPVMRKSDSAIGFLNKLDGTFYTSSGSAQFLAGPVKDDSRYKELEYVSPNGLQYIDTEMKLSSNFEIDTNFMSNHSADFTSYICGNENETVAIGEDGIAGLNIYIGTDNLLYLETGSGDIEIGGGRTFTSGQNYHLNVKQDSEAFTVSIDNTVTYTASAREFDFSSNFYLFAVNREEADDIDLRKSFKGRCYDFKIYTDGELRRDYVAMFNKTSKEYRFYDKQNKKDYILHYSTFEERYEVLDYVQTTGKQYIDTEIANTGTYGVNYEIEFSPVATGDEQIIGAGHKWISSACVTIMSYYQGKYIGQTKKYTNFTKSSIVYNTKQTIKKSGNTITWGTDSVAVTTAGSTLHIYIMGSSKNDYTNNNGWKWYSIKITSEDGAELFNGIPVYDRPCKTVGIYDKISGKLFTPGNSSEQLIAGWKNPEEHPTPTSTLATEEYPYSVPKEYKTLAYIESTGGQYIDTGITISSSTREVNFSAKYRYTVTPTGSQILSGCLDSNSQSYSVFGSSADQSSFVRAGDTYAYLSTGRDTSVHTVFTNADSLASKQTIMVDGTTATNTGCTFPSDINIYLFGRNNNGTLNYAFVGRVYYARYFVDGQLARDFIPVERISDGVVGMYDTVSETFFTNAGTGSFITPKERDPDLPDEYTQVEYIESTGTQYIDSEYIPNTNTQIDTILSVTETNTTGWGFFGSGNSYETTDNMTVTMYGSTPHFTCYVAGKSNFTPDASTIIVDTKYNISVNVAGVTINDKTAETGKTELTTSTRSIYIFRANNGTDPLNRCAKMKLYTFSISEFGLAIHSFIPAKRNSDSVLGMYDTVTGTFFTNAGTGTFTAGPEVIENITYTRVRYIASSGTQYIDTLCSPTTENFEAKVKFRPLGITRGKGFGSSTTSNQNWFTGYYSSDQNLNFFFGTTSNAAATYVATYGDSEINYRTQDGYYYVYKDGVLSGSNTYSGSILPATITYGFLLFTQLDTTRMMAMRLYYCELIEDGALKRDLIPVVDTDGVACLYDLANDTYYKNKGSGTFSIPNNKTYSWESKDFWLTDYVTTGGGYINTGVTAKQITRLEANAKSLSTSSYSYNGSYGDNGQHKMLIWGMYASTFIMGIRETSTTSWSGVTSSANQHTYMLDIPTNTASIDSISKVITSSTVDIIDMPIIIGRYIDQSYSYSTNYSASYALYSYKLYNGTETLRNLIPVIRKGDLVSGLYDIVSKQFFYSTSFNGKFASNTSGYPTDYPNTYKLAQENVSNLQFNNGQYIDTDWTYKPNSEIKMTVMSAGSNVPIIGNNEDNLGFALYPRYGSSNTPQVDVAGTFCNSGVTGSTGRLYKLKYKANTIDFSFYTKGYNGSAVTTVIKTGSAFSTKLADGYTRLIAIQSTGTQYIDSGTTTAWDTEWEWSSNVKSSGQYYWGCNASGGEAIIYSSGCFLAGSNTTLPITLPMNVITTFKYHLDVSGGSHYVQINDGTVADNNGTKLTTGTKIFICATGNAGSSNPASRNSETIYYWICRQSGEVTHYLLPAKRDSDSAVGMYDTITNTFYTNSGSGAFIAIDETSTTSVLGGYRDSDGNIQTNTSSSNTVNVYDCEFYEDDSLVKKLLPVKSLDTDTYGFYNSIENKMYYPENDATIAPSNDAQKQDVEYLQNTGRLSSSSWALDTGILMSETGKITVDLDVIDSSTDKNNMCVFATTAESAATPDAYLCYSSDTVSGVTLTARTVIGSTVTWDYTYSNTSKPDSTVILGTSTTTAAIGTYSYRSVKIYATDKSTLLRDLVPARCGSDVGMYDNVSGQFMYVTASAAPTKNGKTGIYVEDYLPGDPGIKNTEITRLVRIFGAL